MWKEMSEKTKKCMEDTIIKGDFDKIPIALAIDDPAPVVHVMYEHAYKNKTKDGRLYTEVVPNEFLQEFCKVIEAQGIKGKFSIVPMPLGKGDIVNGIPGVDYAQIEEWLEMCRERVGKQFSFGPEMLTHGRAYNLEDGTLYDMIERDWASTQCYDTLRPYVAKALELLKEKNIDVTGVTSPWDFGIEVEDEYLAALSQAMYDVFEKKDCWVFLRELRHTPGCNRPFVAYREEGRNVVMVPTTTRDHFWWTMDTTDTSKEYISSVADGLITADGKEGELIDVINGGGFPVIITHWQSLFSNGLGTGLAALEEVAKRVNKHLGDRVQWMSHDELMKLTIERMQG